MPVERDLFVEIMASYPAGVAVVTTLDADGTPRGLTTTAVSSVSAEPPLLLVCVDLTSRTLPALRAGGRFVVNFLREGRSELARTFASKAEDKFEGVEWSATASGLPVLHADALAWAECVTVHEIEPGDHVILLGQVEEGAQRRRRRRAAHVLPPLVGRVEAGAARRRQPADPGDRGQRAGPDVGGGRALERTVRLQSARCIWKAPAKAVGRLKSVPT